MKARKCNYEIAPYSGNGIDSPICGMPATFVREREAYCKLHVRYVLNGARTSRAAIAQQLAEADARIAALEGAQ